MDRARRPVRNQEHPLQADNNRKMLATVFAFTLTCTPPAYPEVLDDLSKRAVQFFWEQSEPTTGLTRDRGPNTKGGKQNNADICSIASTGYALASYAIGIERGWIPRKDGVARARLTLQTVLGKLEGSHGWYFHFVNGKTGKREWNSEVSSIDSGLLFAGMVLAERGLKDPEYSKLTQQILDRIDWNWMMTDGGAKPSSLTFCHGWKPEGGFLAHRWASFSEHPFLYVLGYSFWLGMPAGSWESWDRPKVEYKGLELITGGPLFMHQMSHGFFDFRDYRDSLGYDYFVEARNATLGNRAYCIENPKRFKGYGPDIWGLSACDIPDGYSAQGAPGWIEDNGTLAPAAAVASMPFTPQESLAAALGFKKQYPQAFGQYGFTTGINPSKDWVSPDVIGIDLGQMMLNIEAHRDGLPHRWMMGHPLVKKGYRKIGLQKTEEGPLDSRKLRIAPQQEATNFTTGNNTGFIAE